MREIVTIQVGGFANFIGSHYWNFQDELLGLSGDPLSDPVFKDQHVNMDVLYRSGETQQGILTYTPRVVSVGFQGSLGTMSSHGTLYRNNSSASTSVSTWNGNVSTRMTEPLKKNLFLQSLDEEEREKTVLGADDSNNEIGDKEIIDSLENNVEYWTDFSKVHYHPQSLYEINGLWVNAQEFDNYGTGREAYSGDREEDINERLRFFIEECDHIQGMQFLVDDLGGFSGLSADFLEHIADEYTNTPVLLYRVKHNNSYSQSLSLKKVISRDLHDSVSFARLSQYCKLIVPLGVPIPNAGKASPFIQVNNEKPYHSSAVYAAALHAISLPFRFEEQGPSANSPRFSGTVDINAVVLMLAGQGRQNMLAVMDAAMPVASLNGKLEKQILLDNWQCLTPQINEDTEDMLALEHTSIQGVRNSGGGYALASQVEQAVNSYYQNASTRPMFSHVSVTQCPLPIPLPFPSIFSNRVGQYGELLDSPIPGSLSRGSLEVHSIPMAARLRSTTAALPFLESRLSNLRKYGLDRGALGGELVRSWGIGRDELEDMGESLTNMIGTLNPHSYASSDSD
uniref:Uncharacterized protein n=2 Tax=Kalanchoe fedtschenkoi TaxID=63787 RepID=A0A7N0T9D6_KALFE